MRHLFASAGAMLCAGCMTSSTPSSIASSTWCSENYNDNLTSWERRSDISVTPVRADRMRMALSALRERSVVPLSEREAASYGSSGLAGVGRPYLARGGATGSIHTTMTELVRELQLATFETHWSRDGNQLALITMQTRHGTNRTYNIAVIIRSQIPIMRVRVNCFSMS